VAVLRSRSRLVTFRLDPEEYASLRRVCIATGARSMSEFAREAVLASVEAGGQAKASLGGDLVTLTNRLHELDRVLKAASGQIEKVLGGNDGPEPNSQEGGGST
jgi:Ribbon-helix-helix protein, copG family